MHEHKHTHIVEQTLHNQDVDDLQLCSFDVFSQLLKAFSLKDYGHSSPLMKTYRDTNACTWSARKGSRQPSPTGPQTKFTQGHHGWIDAKTLNPF